VSRWALLCAGATLAFASAHAQRLNPFETDANAVKAGGSLFAARCADCHGPDATGNRGPDLTTLWTRGATDERVFGTIRTGVAGSIMPPSAAPDTELWAIVAYLRGISTVPPLQTRGDAALGRSLFDAQCAGCHRAGADGGGGIGPDLTQIARARSREALVQSIRDPSAVVADGYRAIALRARGGKTLGGILKHEDAFSLQIATDDGRLLGVSTDALVEVTRGKDSPMPRFGADRLGDAELENLLAFLAARAQPPAASTSALRSSQ
jgi:putative heme-binding domain-containing protein